jgi:hypothetical protein
MAALTAPYDPHRQTGEVRSYPLAAVEVFKGGMAGVLESAGFAQPASDSAGLAFVGVFVESVDNLSGATQPGSITPAIGSPNTAIPAGTAGAYSARVFKTGDYLFNAKAATAATDLGKPCYIADDNTVSVAATTNNVLAGYVTEVVGSAQYRVRIDRAVQ